MAGIYIHIPFCKQACYYCDFHFSTSLKNKNAFLEALHKEIQLQAGYFSSQPLPVEITSVYFGGGTPSLLTSTELMKIWEQLHRTFNINADAEVTLEANPDDINKSKLAEWKETPVNRLSIGIQSFSDADLKFMNRAHNATQGDTSVKMAQDKGYENITIDLIYGTPTMNHQQWQSNLQQSFALEVKHISSYCLTVEDKTALAGFVKSGKVSNVDERQSATQFEVLLEEMNKHDFIQYEISNFCKEGYYSTHNSSYWKKQPYLGLGPSAHSFNGDSRQWNVRNNMLYIKSLADNRLNFEKETLTTQQKFNEYIMTSLRTIWGTDLYQVQHSFGEEVLKQLRSEAAAYLHTHHLVEKENKLFLTDKGKLIADRIASDLFII